MNTTCETQTSTETEKKKKEFFFFGLLISSHFYLAESKIIEQTSRN